MGKNIVVKDGIFYDGSTEEEKKTLEMLHPDKEITVHMIIPGEAHITVHDKTTDQ